MVNNLTEVIKTSDETVTNSTTLQNDNQLVIALDANSLYYCESLVYFTAESVPKYKSDFTIPAGATGRTYETAQDSPTQDTATPNTINVGGGAEQFDGEGQIGFFVQTGGTAGNLQYRWAQDILSATPVTLKAGSALRAWKMTGADEMSRPSPDYTYVIKQADQEVTGTTFIEDTELTFVMEN